MIGNVFVTNDPSALKPTVGAVALAKTIGATPIVVASDSALSAASGSTLANTEVVRVQVKTQPVWVNYHGVATPSATNAIELVAGTIIDLSRSTWLNSTWLRSSGSDGAIVVMQLSR